MSCTHAQSIVLASHPQGALQLHNFQMVNLALDSLQPGEFCFANQYLSIDPYIRPRLNDRVADLEPVELGAIIPGETVAKVIASRTSRFKEGDIIYTFSGWQSHGILSEKNILVRALAPSGLPATAYLNVIGTAGRSAYFGINRIANPVAGETMVISAASGAVGSIAGQIGKLAGCYVVGLAGSEQKCRYVVDVLGFDACLNYHDADFKQQLRQACPDGVDIYFENVGGRVSLLVAQLLNPGARVPICGNVSQYDRSPDASASGPAQFFSSLPNAPLNRFFLVTEWYKDYPESDQWLTQAVLSGTIKYQETLIPGLANAPQALINQLNSRHFGKQIIDMTKDSSAF